MKVNNLNTHLRFVSSYHNTDVFVFFNIYSHSQDFKSTIKHIDDKKSFKISKFYLQSLHY